LSRFDSGTGEQVLDIGIGRKGIMGNIMASDVKDLVGSMNLNVDIKIRSDRKTPESVVGAGKDTTAVECKDTSRGESKDSTDGVGKDVSAGLGKDITTGVDSGEESETRADDEDDKSDYVDVRGVEADVDVPMDDPFYVHEIEADVDVCGVEVFLTTTQRLECARKIRIVELGSGIMIRKILEEEFLAILKWLPCVSKVRVEEGSVVVKMGRVSCSNPLKYVRKHLADCLYIRNVDLARMVRGVIESWKRESLLTM
jgi:hypothetical protein